jgi:hypothetical protein
MSWSQMDRKRLTEPGRIEKAFMLPVLDAGHHGPLRGSIAGQFVRDHHPRWTALTFQKLSKQTLGGFRIAAALDQNVEHVPMLIHGAPEPMFPARNADRNLIMMPFALDAGRRLRI